MSVTLNDKLRRACPLNEDLSLDDIVARVAPHPSERANVRAIICVLTNRGEFKRIARGLYRRVRNPVRGSCKNLEDDSGLPAWLLPIAKPVFAAHSRVITFD